MHRFTRYLLSATTALLLAPIASAKIWDLNQKDPHPVYMGVGIGYGESANSGLGAIAYGGYSFNQNIAAEGILFSTPAYRNDGYTISYGATAKFSFPLPSQLARNLTPYAQAGLAFTHWPDNGGTHVGAVLGGGVDYRLQHNIEIGGKLLTTLSTESPIIVVLTAAYRF